MAYLFWVVDLKNEYQNDQLRNSEHLRNSEQSRNSEQLRNIQKIKVIHFHIASRLN